MNTRHFAFALFLLVPIFINEQPTLAQPSHLHFSHPLIAESPTPDTKFRVDYFFRNTNATGQENEIRFEAEYAFNRNLSVEIDIPYVFTNPPSLDSQSNVGNIKVGLKAASFVFEDKGVVLGGGIELSLPAGDDEKAIGSDRVLKIEPFINAGYKDGGLEVVSFLAFGIPTNEPAADKDEEDLELEFNLALQAHLAANIIGLIELDGSSVVSGTDNKTVVNITPGIKFRPHGNDSMEIGVGVSYPLSNDNSFDPQLILSFFRHF